MHEPRPHPLADLHGPRREIVLHRDRLAHIVWVDPNAEAMLGLNAAKSKAQ